VIFFFKFPLLVKVKFLNNENNDNKKKNGMTEKHLLVTVRNNNNKTKKTQVFVATLAALFHSVFLAFSQVAAPFAAMLFCSFSASRSVYL